MDLVVQEIKLDVFSNNDYQIQPIGNPIIIYGHINHPQINNYFVNNVISCHHGSIIKLLSHHDFTNIKIEITNYNAWPIFQAIAYPNMDDFLVNDVICLRKSVRRAITENTINLYPGDKICQMVLQSFVKYNVLVVPELNNTDRNEKGFGSSGR